MIAASQAVLPPFPGESFVVCDWTALALHASFSVIAGDKVFDNLPPEHWSIFRDRLSEHLDLNGRFVTRLAPVDLELPGQTFTALLDVWSDRYLKSGVSLVAAASGLWEQALGASTSAIPGPQSIARFSAEIKLLDESLAGLPKHKAEVFAKFLELFGDSLGSTWYAYTLGSVIDALAPKLSLVGVRRSTDYEAGAKQPVVSFAQRGA